jgi:hypothetical protein
MADHPAQDEKARNRQAQRLAAALRENLKRRKHQARGRASASPDVLAGPKLHDASPQDVSEHESPRQDDPADRSRPDLKNGPA